MWMVLGRGPVGRLTSRFWAAAGRAASDKANAHASRLDSRPLTRKESTGAPIPAMPPRLPQKNDMGNFFTGIKRTLLPVVFKFCIAILPGPAF